MTSSTGPTGPTSIPLEATLSDGSPRCQAITEYADQCSRKAEPNSLYCWQHQDYKNKSKLTQQALQPGILSNILTTAGYSGGLNQESKKYVRNDVKAELKAWFQRIKVKSNLDTIPENQIPFLNQIYQKRIGDRPDNDLIYSLVDQGFDRYIFYSKVIDFDQFNGLTVENIDFLTTAMQTKQDLVAFTNWAKTLPKFSQVREGDILQFKIPIGTQAFVYNGVSLEYLLIHSDESTLFTQQYILPADIYINNYPLVDYFRTEFSWGERFLKTDMVNLKTTGKDLTLIWSPDDSTFLFQTSDGYLIFTDNSDLSDWYLRNTSLVLGWNFGDMFTKPEDPTDYDIVLDKCNELLTTNRLILFDSYQDMYD